jgi:adenylyltransferase/sulfurtransferase
MPSANAFQNCELAGVLNVLPGMFGIIQATEIIKWILQQGDLLAGLVLTVDILKMQFREYTLPKNPDCDLCGNHRMIPPVQKSEPCFGDNAMREYTISCTELNELLKKKADIELVDVRTLDKHMAYNIGGKHIPTSELSDRFNELDPKKLVVTYCTMGGNSMRALQFLLSAGFTSVKSLDGGMTAWKDEVRE